MNALAPIIAATRADMARRREEVPFSELERAAQGRDDHRSFLDALKAPGLSVIAEHKRRSPSAGSIRESMALEDIVSAYERGGAAALSILTERANFGGSLDDLRAARVAAGLPILRKDFVVDSYQVLEAFVGGADAILLIVAALDEDRLGQLHRQTLALGLDALVEVHDRGELDRAAAVVGAGLIGINNRDLTTLEVDPRRTFELLSKMPPGATVVAESGFSRPDQMDELQDAGVDAVLIGEALMRASDIEKACRALTTRNPARAL